jgi:hypothetical protein
MPSLHHGEFARMHASFRSISLAAAIVLPLTAHAQSASEAEARKIEEGLISVLPERVAKDDAIKIRTSGDQYEMQLDLRNWIARTITPWAVTEVTPIIQKLALKDDGLWQIGGKSNFKLATELAAANRSNSFLLTIGEYDTKGVFDPGISFLRDSDIKLSDVLVNMRSGQDSIKVGMKDFAVRLDVADQRAGIGDVKAVFNATDLVETFGAFPNPELKIAGATLAGQQTFDSVDFAGIKKLVAFWQGSARGKRIPDLNEDERRALAAVIAAHRPFMARAGEETNVDNVTLSSGGKGFSIETFGYHWAFEDIGKDGTIRAGLTLENPKALPGTWPAGLEQAMPKSLAVNIRYQGFKLGPMWDLLSDPKTIAVASGEAADNLSKTLLPDGRVVMEFSNTYMRSEHYELTVDGKLFMRPGKRDDQSEADINITAKDFDKTLKFLQDGAKTVPAFGQASFFALMAKGMGRVQPDGSMLWNVKMDNMGKITINGQPLPV